MPTLFAYVGAALAEIAGCFSFWAWLRLGKSQWWLVPGMASLALFAWLLTLVDNDAAGRAYAVYANENVAGRKIDESILRRAPHVLSVEQEVEGRGQTPGRSVRGIGAPLFGYLDSNMNLSFFVTDAKARFLSPNHETHRRSHEADRRAETLESSGRTG